MVKENLWLLIGAMVLCQTGWAVIIIGSAFRPAYARTIKLSLLLEYVENTKKQNVF